MARKRYAAPEVEAADIGIRMVEKTVQAIEDLLANVKNDEGQRDRARAVLAPWYPQQIRSPHLAPPTLQKGADDGTTHRG